LLHHKIFTQQCTFRHHSYTTHFPIKPFTCTYHNSRIHFHHNHSLTLQHHTRALSIASKHNRKAVLIQNQSNQPTSQATTRKLIKRVRTMLPIRQIIQFLRSSRQCRRGKGKHTALLCHNIIRVEAQQAGKLIR